MAFNDTPGRPHKQKFRLSVSPLAELVDRSTASISNILKKRKEEIEKHHEAHNISMYHNKMRKDPTGNPYPPMESEPEINYQKVTEVAKTET